MRPITTAAEYHLGLTSFRRYRKVREQIALFPPRPICKILAIHSGCESPAFCH